MIVRSTMLLIVAPVALACGGIQVLERNEYEGPRIPRPGRIIVYDFAATPADLPTWSEAHEKHGGAPGEADAATLKLGRQLGSELAGELVAEIRDMGLPAVRAQGQRDPEVDDIVLIGYFATVDPGSSVKRVVLGFGTGKADLTTHVEGYRMTEEGLVLAGSGESGTGRSEQDAPGVVVPALVTVATANPVGLIVGGGFKVYGEVSGKSTIHGTARETAEKIAEVLEEKFEELDWI